MNINKISMYMDKLIDKYVKYLHLFLTDSNYLNPFILILSYYLIIR